MTTSLAPDSLSGLLVKGALLVSPSLCVYRFASLCTPPPPPLPAPLSHPPTRSLVRLGALPDSQEIVAHRDDPAQTRTQLVDYAHMGVHLESSKGSTFVYVLVYASLIMNIRLKRKRLAYGYSLETVDVLISFLYTPSFLFFNMR